MLKTVVFQLIYQAWKKLPSPPHLNPLPRWGEENLGKGSVGVLGFRDEFLELFIVFVV